MSTRSYIAKIDDNGRTTVVYCHSDGYLDYVGKILANYYTHPDKVDALLALGNISMLGITPVDDPRMWDYLYDCEETPEGFCVKCRTYKGRGDKDEDATVYPSYDKMVEDTGRGQDYNYVYKNGVWYYGSFGWPDFDKGPLKRVPK